MLLKNNPENLDEYHKEQLKKAQAEKEATLNEINAFMAYNPGKLIPEVIDNISHSLDKNAEADDDGNDGKWINRTMARFISGTLGEALYLLNHLQDQVEAKKRRDK